MPSPLLALFLLSKILNFKEMKHLLLILLAGSLFTATTYCGYAQKNGDVLLPVRNAGSDAAAIKATSLFWKVYGESKGEKWYNLPKGYMAEFTEKSVGVKVIYNQRGDWVYTLRQYTEKELPMDIRAQVRSLYYDDTIGVIKEVIQLQYTVYLIHIENGTRWKTIRFRDGEMDVVEDFKKS
jgi:hypothetical protein